MRRQSPYRRWLLLNSGEITIYRVGVIFKYIGFENFDDPLNTVFENSFGFSIQAGIRSLD
jgi:hypothetical protein